MLAKFREEREKRKMAPPSSTPAPSAGGPPTTGTPSRSGDRGGDYRSSRGGEEYRDRDRGYDRHSSSRYESVSTSSFAAKLTCCLAIDAETGNVPEAQEGDDTSFRFGDDNLSVST